MRKLWVEATCGVPQCIESQEKVVKKKHAAHELDARNKLLYRISQMSYASCFLVFASGHFLLITQPRLFAFDMLLLFIFSTFL